MYKIEMLFEGLSPLRMNRFSPDALKGTSVKLSREELIQDAHVRSYQDAQGYYIPGLNVKTAICYGGKRVKVGRLFASASMRAIFHVEDKVRLGTGFTTEIEEGYVQIPPGSGKRVVKFWVCFPRWTISFACSVLDDRFPPEAIRNSAKEAGLYCGLLDGRPEHGRFSVEDFRVVE